VEADELTVTFGEEEALGVEPRLAFAHTHLLDAPPTLLGMSVEGTVVERRPCFFVCADAKRPHRHPCGQVRGRDRREQ
jgi:hypothetical protein